MDAIFAYGTLMRGESRHGVLAAAGPLRIVAATAQGRLINIGPYPAVLEGDETVHGEYCEFEDLSELLPRLDGIEGSDYRRERVRVVLDGGEEAEAWMYLWNGTLQDGPRIMTGSWRLHRGRALNPG
ncbi:MAG: gamma-glutamylcyclotransferase [Bryobacteraceae bacterium]|nr:gamma-glutamylcyclotransferase [Bryobacteraceae bacterium]